MIIQPVVVVDMWDQKRPMSEKKENQCRKRGYHLWKRLGYDERKRLCEQCTHCGLLLTGGKGKK